MLVCILENKDKQECHKGTYGEEEDLVIDCVSGAEGKDTRNALPFFIFTYSLLMCSHNVRAMMSRNQLATRI